MRRILLILLILVCISGCVEMGTVTTNYGVVIENFETDFDSLFSGEPVQFQIRIFNQGNTDATIENLEIVGIELGGSGWTEIKNTCKELLNKVIISKTRKNCVWEFNSPMLDQGLSASYEPKLRLSYLYKTTTISSVTLGTSDELRRMKTMGKIIPTKTSTTGGPVSINVITTGPIKLSDGSVTFPIKIEVKNIGGGTVCEGSCKQENWNKIKLNIKTDMKLTDCKKQEEVQLWKGQSNTIVCSLTAPSRISGIEEKIIEVSSEYGYITEKTTSLSIVRKKI
jgi:hypothetical protein